VRFPKEESGRQRKLSRPWHGYYWIISQDDPDLTESVFPDDGSIQSRVTKCPSKFPAGYYWYSNKRKGPGHPLNDLLTIGEDKETPQSQTDSLQIDSLSDVAEEPEICDSDSEPVEAESTPVRAGTERYGLRGRVTPRKKQMRVDISTQDELVQEGSDVTVM
jgi:hypothetical protein